MTADPHTISIAVTNWDQLPLLLGPVHMAALYGVSVKTINRWQRNGHIPLPVVTAGQIRRWQRELVRQHLERRQAMR